SPASWRERAASRARMASTASSDVPSGTWVVMVTRYSIGSPPELGLVMPRFGRASRLLGLPVRPPLDRASSPEQVWRPAADILTKLSGTRPRAQPGMVRPARLVSFEGRVGRGKATIGRPPVDGGERMWRKVRVGTEC